MREAGEGYEYIITIFRSEQSVSRADLICNDIWDTISKNYSQSSEFFKRNTKEKETKGMNNLTQEEQPNGSSRNDEKNNDSPQWNGRCYARARPKSSRPSPLLPPRRKSPDHAQRYTNEATLSRAHSIKFLSTRSVQRRGRGVSFGGRTTSFHGVQKGAEGRRSTVAPCRGGSTAPTHTHLVFVAPRNTRTLSSPPPSSYHHVEREAHTDAPPRLLNRALSLSLSLSLEVC